MSRAALARAMPWRDNDCGKQTNVFIKPSAEPNLFRLCRGEKTKRENQLFYSAITDCTDTPPRQNATEICSCPRLIRTLAAPKILPLGNAQINLTLPSAYSFFGCAEDTPARQCANKFDIALAYSYLCQRRRRLRSSFTA